MSANEVPNVHKEMHDAEQPKSVHQLFNEVHRRIARDGIAKSHQTDARVGGYVFRGIDDVYNALSPILADVGLMILPSYSDRKAEVRSTKNGGQMFCVSILGTFRFVSAQDGSSETITVVGEGMDTSDKATNKAMSAAMKYACLQAFQIPTESASEESDKGSPELGYLWEADPVLQDYVDALREHFDRTDEKNDPNPDMSGFMQAWDELSEDQKRQIYNGTRGKGNGYLDAKEKQAWRTSASAWRKENQQ